MAIVSLSLLGCHQAPRPADILEEPYDPNIRLVGALVYINPHVDDSKIKAFDAVGTFISPEWLILTSASALQGRKDIPVGFLGHDGGLDATTATVYVQDAGQDLALLKVEGRTTPRVLHVSVNVEPLSFTDPYFVTRPGSPLPDWPDFLPSRFGGFIAGSWGGKLYLPGTSSDQLTGSPLLDRTGAVVGCVVGHVGATAAEDNFTTAGHPSLTGSFICVAGLRESQILRTVPYKSRVRSGGKQGDREGASAEHP